MIASIEEDHSSLEEAHATRQVEGSVALTIAHQRVRIGLQQKLDHLVLPGQHCQVQERLKGGQGDREERGEGGYSRQGEEGEEGVGVDLFEVVEAVYHRCLCGGELRQDIKQLQHQVLMVVDDGQVQCPACVRCVQCVGL